MARDLPRLRVCSLNSVVVGRIACAVHPFVDARRLAAAQTVGEPRCSRRFESLHHGFLAETGVCAIAPAVAVPQPQIGGSRFNQARATGYAPWCHGPMSFAHWPSNELEAKSKHVGSVAFSGSRAYLISMLVPVLARHDVRPSPRLRGRSPQGRLSVFWRGTRQLGWHIPLHLPGLRYCLVSPSVLFGGTCIES